MKLNFTRKLEQINLYETILTKIVLYILIHGRYFPWISENENITKMVLIFIPFNTLRSIDLIVVKIGRYGLFCFNPLT